jgi:hypothetical protein
MRASWKTIARLATKASDRRAGVSSTFLSVFVGAWLGATTPAQAASFNLTFDASTAAAPAAFFTAFNHEILLFQVLFLDPITINLHVGWGDIAGGPIAPGNLGQSLTNQRVATYAALKAALTADAKTAADATAIATLPSSDPTPGTNFVMSNAEAKALGLFDPIAPGIDGWVGFDKNATFTFDPNNREVAGAYDFLGLADHEITEVMGRYGFGQNGSGARDSPIDLFRYFSPGVRDLSAAFGAANYFSIDDADQCVQRGMLRRPQRLGWANN